MPIAKIIRLNLALIVVVGLYGLVTDEPYWRADGHGPSLYDYLFWFALVLNGPSGIAADYMSWLGADDAELRFVIQFCAVGRVALAAVEAVPCARTVVPERQLQANHSV